MALNASLPVPLWPGVLKPIRVISMGQIDLFENYLYLIWLGSKTKKKKTHKRTNKEQLHKKRKYERTKNAVP